MSEQLPAFFGVVKYEFLMQVRRPVLWITFLGLGLLFVRIGRGGPFSYIATNPFHLSSLTLAAEWTRNLMFVFPIAIGVLLADRLARDRRRKMEELLLTLPSATNTRMLGKYLGSTLATIIPLFLYDCIGIGSMLFSSHNLMVIPDGLLTFAAVALPGLLFVSAFSIACPAIMWVPLYQLLFIGYWFWGNILGTTSLLPSLSTTILTPVGGYMASGFFGDNLQLIEHATVVQGMESVLLLLGITALVLYSLCKIVALQQVHQ